MIVARTLGGSVNAKTFPPRRSALFFRFYTQFGIQARTLEGKMYPGPGFLF